MEKVSTARIALKWGLIYGLVSIAITTLIYTLNLLEQQSYTIIVSLILSFGILYLAYNEFKTLNAGFMTFGEGVGLGMLLFVTSGVVYSLFDFVYKKFIDPTIVDKILAMSEKQYESMGMSPEIIEMSLEKARPFIDSPIAIFIAIFSSALIGLICSLIMSAIMKKNQPVFE